MYKALFYTHLVSVNIFLFAYLIKTILLVANKKEALAKFTKAFKVPEMIISTLFLATGIYLLMQMGTTKLLIIKICVVLVSIPVAIVGFKKGNKVLAVLSMLMIISAYGLAEMNKKRIEKQTIDPALSDTNAFNYDIQKHGEALYNAYCVNCHGAEGHNGVGGGADLTISKKSFKEMADQIRTGSSSMAPYKNVMNEQEISAVVTYIVTFKK